MITGESCSPHGVADQAGCPDAYLLIGGVQVGMCAGDRCGWLFVDTSKNHSRRWCDMKICGNRMKARRFKAQHRA